MPTTFIDWIQRAENITLLYNTSSDGLNRGGRVPLHATITRRRSA